MDIGLKAESRAAIPRVGRGPGRRRGGFLRILVWFPSLVWNQEEAVRTHNSRSKGVMVIRFALVLQVLNTVKVSEVNASGPLT